MPEHSEKKYKTYPQTLICLFFPKDQINELASPLGLTFFGLTSKSAPEIRKALFRQIHEIVFHGKGGYDWHTIYNMPIWLRKYTFTLIKDHYEEEAKAVKKAQEGKNQQNLTNSDGKVSAPNFKKRSSYK